MYFTLPFCVYFLNDLMFLGYLVGQPSLMKCTELVLAVYMLQLIYLLKHHNLLETDGTQHIEIPLQLSGRFIVMGFSLIT